MKVSDTNSKEIVNDLEEAIANLSLNQVAEQPIKCETKEILLNQDCVAKYEKSVQCLEISVNINCGNKYQNHKVEQSLDEKNYNSSTSSLETTLGELSLSNEDSKDESDSDSKRSDIRKRGPNRNPRQSYAPNNYPYTNQRPNLPPNTISIGCAISNGYTTLNKSKDECIPKIIEFLKSAEDQYNHRNEDRHLPDTSQDQYLPDLPILLGDKIVNPLSLHVEIPETIFTNHTNSSHSLIASGFENVNSNYHCKSSIENYPLGNQTFTENTNLVGKTLPITVPENANIMSENQYSPQSTCSPESGYMSDRSSSCSPVSVFTTITSNKRVVPILPNCTSQPVEVKIVNNAPKARISRNKFMGLFDELTRERKRKQILKLARKEGGVNLRDDNNRTLLHLAIEQKDEALAVVFINMLENSFQNSKRQTELAAYKDLPAFLNQQDNKGFTPLLTACYMNSSMLVEYLLQCGAEPTLTENGNKDSPMHYVCKRGKRYKEVLENLCKKMDPNLANYKGQTPLHYAVGYHNKKHVDANTGLSEIIDNIPLIEVLLSNNAKLGSQDEMGRTPLHWLVISKEVQLLPCLLSRACDLETAVNKQNSKGRTVLHEAVNFNGEFSIQKYLVETLLVWKASLAIPDFDGKFPKDFAVGNKSLLLDILNPKVVGFLDWMCP